MDESPETLREIAQYLRNSTRLFPSPRASKAYEWLTRKLMTMPRPGRPTGSG